MKRPLLIVAISYILGIIIGVYFKIGIPIIVFIGVSLMIIMLIINKQIYNKDNNKIIYIRKYFFNKKNVTIIMVIVVTTLIASAKTIFLNNKYNSLYKNIKDITVVGTICSTVKVTDYRYIVNINVERANEKQQLLSNKISKKYNNTKLILNIKKDEKDCYKLKYGNKILLTGTYEEPEVSRNYKGFNYKEYLKTKEIYGTLIVDNMDRISVIKRNNADLIHLCVNKISQKFDNNLKQILPQETATLAKGILLGDSSDITDEIKDNFKNCNLSHMLAVSGSHLAYLILGLNLILNKKILGIKNTKIIKIIIIILFMMITNMSPSVVRAGISVILAITATLINRKSDKYTTIAIAAMFTLIRNPFSIFNIGMQLSYLGTIGILIFAEKIQKYLDIKLKLEKNSETCHETNSQVLKKPNIDNQTNIKCGQTLPRKTFIKIKNYIIQSTAVTLSANILIFPLIIYNFNTISLNFIISNLIASPILGICIVFGLFTLIISIISIPLAKIIAIPFNLFLNILIKITSLISKIPMSNITVTTPHIITIIGAYLVIFIILWNKKKVKNIIKKQFNEIPFKVMSFLIVITIMGTSVFSTLCKNKNLRIYFIDVGQGDSSLICTPTGKNILIDGGGSRTPEKYDVGEKVLVPYLLDRGIKKLDYIIVSHFDADHAQGLEEVIKTINVRNIVISKQASICSEYEKIMSLCKKRKIKVIVVKRGGKIKVDKYIYFDILHPGDKMLDDGKGGLNANAIVAKLYYKMNRQDKVLSISTMINPNNYNHVKNKTAIKINTRYFTILFTGDIEEDAEKELVSIYGKELKCDILKVAHHGSKTSSTYEFLQCANPSIVLIGVGQNNTFGHPNKRVIERLESINARIFRTDVYGEIEINIDD